MNIGTIITWILKLIGLFRGGSSSRITLDVRSESSIEAERKRLDKLWAKMTGIDNEIKDTIHRLVKAKKDGDTTLEGRLNDKRDLLIQQYQEVKRQYENLNNNG